MPVPDEVVFGPKLDGGPITYGEVRTIHNPNDRIQLLRKRINTFFIGQTDVLEERSPFPMTVMTCIAIETFGKIFIRKTNDTQSNQFVQFASKMDQRFGRNLSKKFKKEFNKLWPEGDQESVKTYGELLYKYFRNSMIHAYKARGVYLSNQQEGMEIKNGFITLNPNWLWERTKEKYNDLIVEAETGEDNSVVRTNCLTYIDSILQ